MAHSAKQARRGNAGLGPIEGGALALGALAARNPGAVGGTTAFLVAFAFVSANALWYQPHAHSGAFFATRDYLRAPGVEDNTTTVKIARPGQEERWAGADPLVLEVQSILKDLNFYTGAVDGLAGPNTRNAIEAYQKTVGLPVTGMIEERLLEHLGAAPATSAITPPVAPLPESVSERPAAQGMSEPKMDGRIMKIQAGLRAFGNEGVEIDGVLGERTRAAIREFQVLFGLPETGVPDEALYAKMSEIGLTN